MGDSNDSGSSAAAAGKGHNWAEVRRDSTVLADTAQKGKGKRSKPLQLRGSVARSMAELVGTGQASSSSSAWTAPPPEAGDQGHSTGDAVAAVGMEAASSDALGHCRTMTPPRASGFEPTHNTCYICGRPVQVFIWFMQERTG